MSAQSTSKQETPTPQAAQGREEAPARETAAGGNSARANVLRTAAAAGGGGGGAPLPYKDEMEGFFGIDLSKVRAIFGADLGGLDAKAAQAGEVVAFAEPNPSKEQVAHEVAHVVQQQGRSPLSGTDKNGAPGTTQPGEGAEVQAEAAAQAFISGGEAPTLDAAPKGIARDAETGTPLERLREAADGNWIGNVDEDHCLALINMLSESEKATARGDNGLMQKLAGAFDREEMLQCVNVLGFELKWKAWWLKAAGELNIGARWHTLMADAPREELMAFIGWADLFQSCIPYFNTSPRMVFASVHGTPDWGPLLAANPSIVRWLVASVPESDVVREIAGPGITDGDLATISPLVGAVTSWTDLLDELPSGGAMPADLRACLHRLKDVWDVDTNKAAFEVRFDHSLTTRTEKKDKPGKEANLWDHLTGNAETVDWSNDTIRAVWNQLDVLPDQDVTENTVLGAFQAIHDGIGAAGYYAGGDIQVTQGIGVAGLDHTIRHEIGHSVHDGPLKGTINTWLQKDVGFWYMDKGKSGHRQLIDALGGYPSTWTDSAGTAQTFSDDDKDTIVDMLDEHTGDDGAFKFQGPDLPNVTTPATDTDRKWAAMPANVRSCYELSKNNWYDQYAAMPSGTKGQMFWNHYYKRPYYYSSVAAQTVAATGDNYTAMSEKEFFANCYAEFFKDPAGYNDHSLWGGNLPAAVSGFMRSVVLDRQPYTPPSGAGAAGGAGGPGTGSGTPAPATSSEGAGAA